MKERIIWILVLVISCISCEKFMRDSEVNLSDLSDEKSMNQALDGMYNRLARMHQAFYFFQILKGDDITYLKYNNRTIRSLGDPPPVNDEGKLNFDDNLSYVGSSGFDFSDYEKPFLIWEGIYNTLIQANNIIEKYEKGELDHNLYGSAGEALFVRAYCFYRLVRIFGQAALVTNVDVSYTLSISKPKEIYTQIEKDLVKAISLLPLNNSSARIPFATPHRGSAKAFLAEVYLTMGGYPLNDHSKYSLAAKLAGEVIDSADFYGFGLMPDYAEIWEGMNNANQESVFSIYYNVNYDNVGFGADREVINHRHIETLNLNYFKYIDIIVETNFYNSFPKSYRKDVTYMNYLEGYAYHFDTVPIYDSLTGRFLLDTLAILSFDHYYDTMKLGDNLVYLKQHIQDQQLPMGQKGLYTVTNYLGKVNDMNTSLYVFRYSHVLLTYAEAKARSGQLDDSAYEAVNQVRRRANQVDIFASSDYDLTPGLSAGQFTDSVVWERAWEFCGEFEGRWFDLVRLEKVEELPELRHPAEGGFPREAVTKDDYFIPIPDEAMVWF